MHEKITRSWLKFSSTNKRKRKMKTEAAKQKEKKRSGALQVKMNFLVSSPLCLQILFGSFGKPIFKYAQHGMNKHKNINKQNTYLPVVQNVLLHFSSGMLPFVIWLFHLSKFMLFNFFRIKAT